jgi:hypothetical protein
LKVHTEGRREIGLGWEIGQGRGQGSDAILITQTGEDVEKDARAVSWVADLIEDVAPRPAVETTIGLQLSAGLEPGRDDRRLQRVRRIVGVEVAERTGRVAVAIGIAGALLAEVLAANQSRAEVAVRTEWIVSGEGLVRAVRVGEALIAAAEVPAHVAEVGSGLAHPAGQATIAAGNLAKDVASIDQRRK